MKYFTIIICFWIFSAVVTCQSPTNVLDTYVPQVTFAGVLNGDDDSMPGNTNWRNTCKLLGDTIRIYMYSKKFSLENNIRFGDLMWIDLFPHPGDTMIGTADCRFHLARYSPENSSYYVAPSDSMNQYKKVQIKIDNLQHNVGGIISLVDMYVITAPDVSGQQLIIKNGRIKGIIH